MTPLRASIDIASHPAPVWELIANLEHWPSWGVTITAVDPPTGQVRPGLVGRVRTVAGLWLPFQITDVIEGESWNWNVAGVTATGHQVTPTEGGCRVTFTAPTWAPFYRPVLTRALQALRRSIDA